MSESPIETLRRMAVFGGLSADTLTMILDQSQLCRTAAGEYFFTNLTKQIRCT
jgi:hypothetical protein